MSSSSISSLISSSLLTKTTTITKPLYTTNLTSKKTLSFPIIKTITMSGLFSKNNIPEYLGKGPPEFPFQPKTEPPSFPKENPTIPIQEPEIDPSVPPEIVTDPSRIDPFPNPNPKPDEVLPLPPRPPEVVPACPPGPEIVPPPSTPPPPTGPSIIL
ncbi:unnamed protein product [Trifolium pratense]|uniref:Uncharacterized protein n=1 Tax=Trifolium pratense TaxID=57577 RepID=A0ACB0LX79_TRIPR|nr:unnamed protein product [Trifolium pratense]